MKFKTITSALLLVLGSSIANADTWSLDQTHTRVGFEIDHMGYSTTHGIFKAYEGTVKYDRENPSTATLNFTINTDSITTLTTDLDNHLQQDDFFNTEKFPTITFKSTEVTLNKEDKGTVKGELTMLGKTQPITLNLTINKDEMSPLTKLETIGFSATTTIKRSEWGMDTMIPAVSDKVVIKIDGELNQISKP